MTRQLTLGERLKVASSILLGAAPGRFGPTVSAAEWNGRFTEAQEINSVTAMNTSAVFACSTLLADTQSQQPLGVYRKEGERRIPQPEHPVSRLLAGMVNDYSGRRGFIRAVELQRQLTGNGMAQVERDQSGVPVGLWPLASAAPRRRADGTLIYETGHGDQRVELAASDVIHLRGPSLDGGLSGISPVQAARRAIQSANAIESFGLDFFRNEARSGGFLQHPGRLSEPAKANIVKTLKSQGNPDRSPANVVEPGNRHHNIKVLEEGMKWVPTTIAPEEAQFLASREFQISEIARWFRIPLVLLQSTQGSTVWGTGIESLLIGFTQFTILPLSQSWEEEATLKLLSDDERAAGLYIRMDVRSLLRGDTAARAAFYASGIQNQWLLPNEARALEELDGIEGGDTPLSRAPQPRTE